jgi:hypothetical protein
VAAWTSKRRVTTARAILGSLFPEQMAAVADPCKFKALLTTRRAGKTWTPLSDFVADGLIHPRSMYIHVALTHNNSEIIAWPILKDLDRQYGIKGRFQEQKLRYTLPTGSSIQLYGANRPGWSDRLYGTKLKGAAIDEAAFYTVDISELVADVLGPALLQPFGDRGTLYLMSIPGKVPAGLFYELTRQFPWAETYCGRVPEPSSFCPTAGRWSVHSWTTEANPYMGDQFLKEIEEWKAADPECEKDPRFMRNYRKAWVYERGEQVYIFDSERNTYPGEFKPQPGLSYVLGVDFGWKDATATSLCAYGNGMHLVEVESWRQPGILLGDLASHIAAIKDRYSIGDWAIVGDPAHLQLFEEFRRVHGVPMMEGEKSKKFDQIKIINSWFRQGIIWLVDPSSSPHVDEMSKLRWRVKVGGEKVEQPGQANDCCDAFMLARRHAAHYMQGEEEPVIPDEATVNKRQRNAMIEAEIERMEDERAGRWNDW